MNKTSVTDPAKKYFCPMDEGMESDEPGACPKCGMAFERNPTFREPAKTIYTCPMPLLRLYLQRRRNSDRRRLALSILRAAPQPNDRGCSDVPVVRERDRKRAALTGIAALMLPREGCRDRAAG